MSDHHTDHDDQEPAEVDHSGYAETTGNDGAAATETPPDPPADTAPPPDTGTEHEAPARRPMIALRHGARFMVADSDGVPSALYTDTVYLMPEVAAKIPPDVLVKHVDQR